ncbi:hypothetical protein IGI04_007574 [Brassica rapa subsp. trilocularis]|uniref:CCHC-type domain-containing protein n=1 Tax=Brassica rapa subsp. trilocularis TaxID=1813537 RepID=A0ABQ7NKA2_BRACM|nr:hypothetical protein IGI04_007574 [Brassica rapa subsp. trilocularis]
MTLREGGMYDIHHALKYVDQNRPPSQYIVYSIYFDSLSISLLSKKKTLTKVKAENELMLSRFEHVIISNNQLILMTGQDKVLLVHGTWARDSDQRWIFEPDITCKVEHFIRIFSGMTMTELLTSVRERYQLSSTDATLKLSYQYPEWVSFGDGELEMPQYITEDTEVGVFLNMRRSIEEVPLYVSIYRQSHGGKKLTKGRETEQRVPMAEDVGDGIDEEDWHTFALSETPLTIPLTQPKTKAIPHEVPDYSVSKAVRCKEKRKRRDPTHATSPQTGTNDRGKNKRPKEKKTDSESDSDDDMVVPVVPAVVGETGEGSRPVRRRLLFGNSGIPDTDGGVGDSNSSSDDSEELPVDNGLHWGKFDEALHEMLNNPYTPAFFGRDAPPIFNNREETGLQPCSACHMCCHLWRNVIAKYKSSRLANLMSAAARAFTVTEFNKKFFEIQKISPNCAAYLPILNTKCMTPPESASQFYWVPVLAHGEYQLIGISCMHALACSTRVRFPSDALVAPAYHVPTWRQGFIGKIYPVPSVGGLELGSGTRAPLLPPAVRRPPGRPRKVCILSREEYKKEESSSNRKCKRCGRSGHNRASCRNLI